MSLNVLEELQQDLIAAGIVRKPSLAGGLPPAWLERTDGAPAPGEGSGTSVGNDVVVHLGRGVSPGSVEFEGFLHVQGVDITIRSRRPDTAWDLYLKIKRRLDDRRAHFMLGDIAVEQALMVNPLGLVSTDPAQGYTYRCTLMLWVRDEEFGA